MARLVPFAFLAITGCSITLDGPPPVSIGRAPTCETSKALVVTDALAGSLLGVAALTQIDGEPGIGAVLGVASAVLIGSALRGNTVVDRCREAQDSWAHYARRTRVPEGERDVRQVAPITEAYAPVSAPVMVPAARPLPPASPAQTRPPPPSPSQPPPTQPSPASAQDAESDEWSEFWTEAP